MTCNFFKKRPQHRCFPVEFVKLSRTVLVASENRQHITDLKIFVQGNEFVVVLKNLKLGAATFSLVFSASMQQFACCYFKESFLSCVIFTCSFLFTFQWLQFNMSFSFFNLTKVLIWPRGLEYHFVLCKFQSKLFYCNCKVANHAKNVK